MKPETKALHTDLECRLQSTASPNIFTFWFKFETFSYQDDCHVTETDIPELIEMVRIWADQDRLDDWVDVKGDESFREFPIHAWRALGELGAVEAVEPLLEVLSEVADDDDWLPEDLPHVLGLMGESVVPQVTEFVNHEFEPASAKMRRMNALAKIANSETQSCSVSARRLIIDFLTDEMRHAGEHPHPIDPSADNLRLDFIQFNSSLLAALLDLKVAEAAPFIEKAFSENQIDCGYAGEWEAVRNQLGVREIGLPMPKEPINSLANFRERIGIGIFSDRPLAMLGERDEEATEAYFESAMNAFECSPEGQTVVERSGRLGWAPMFLQYALDYLGVTVDTMKVADVEEIVFDIFPNKVSTEPESAESIVFELRKFWEFIDRVFDHPTALELVALLDDDATRRLTRGLSDTSNFGMAKSMHMQGISAGFDMTSQEGLNAFMLAHNAARLASLSKRPRTPPAPKMSVDEKKAFDKKRKKKLSQKLKKSRR